MRDYGKVAPTFWTRGTGKTLRRFPCAQRLALYLMSSPNANMLGLYYLPTVMISHDTGMTIEEVEGALEVLTGPLGGGFLEVDEDADTVFVRTMARRQLGLDGEDRLRANDNRVKHAIRIMKECSSPRLLQAFWEEYHEILCLPEPWWGKGVETPFGPPSDPLRSQDQDQDQDQEQEQESDPSRFLPPTVPDLVVPPSGGSECAVAPSAGRALSEKTEPPKGVQPSLIPDEPEPAAKPKPKPKRKPKVVDANSPAYTQVVEIWHKAFEAAKGAKPVFTAKDGRHVKRLLEIFGGDVDRIRALIDAAFEDEWFVENRASLMDIVSNPNRFVGASKSTPPPEDWSPKPKHFAAAEKAGYSREWVVSKAEYFKAYSEEARKKHRSWDGAFTTWMLRDMQREEPDINPQWRQLEDAPIQDPEGTQYYKDMDEKSRQEIKKQLEDIGLASSVLGFGEAIE